MLIAQWLELCTHTSTQGKKRRKMLCEATKKMCSHRFWLRFTLEYMESAHKNELNFHPLLLTQIKIIYNLHWHYVPFGLPIKILSWILCFNFVKIFLLKIYAAKTQKTDPPLLDVGDCSRNEFFRGNFRTLCDSCRTTKERPERPESRRVRERESAVCMWEKIFERIVTFWLPGKLNLEIIQMVFFGCNVVAK